MFSLVGTSWVSTDVIGKHKTYSRCGFNMKAVRLYHRAKYSHK